MSLKNFFARLRRAFRRFAAQLRSSGARRTTGRRRYAPSALEPEMNLELTLDQHTFSLHF